MHNYYTHIEDLPLRNWRKITEKGDLTYTRIEGKEGTKKEDFKHAEILQDSFLEEFGFSAEQLRVFELQADIALLECDLVITDNNFLKNKIKRLKRELEELQSRNGSDFDEVIHYIEVWRGIEVNEYTMTTRKFFKLLNTYKKEVEKNKKALKA